MRRRSGVKMIDELAGGAHLSSRTSARLCRIQQDGNFFVLYFGTSDVDSKRP